MLCSPLLPLHPPHPSLLPSILLPSSPSPAQVTTKCVVAELVALGPQLSGAVYIAKRFKQRVCGHKKDKPATDCIMSLVGKPLGSADMHYITTRGGGGHYITTRGTCITSPLGGTCITSPLGEWGSPCDQPTCITSPPGEGNPHRYFVASQDKALQTLLRDIPGMDAAN